MKLCNLSREGERGTEREKQRDRDRDGEEMLSSHKRT